MMDPWSYLLPVSFAGHFHRHSLIQQRCTGGWRSRFRLCTCRSRSSIRSIVFGEIARSWSATESLHFKAPLSRSRSTCSRRIGASL